MSALGPDVVFVVLGAILAVAVVAFIAGRVSAPGACDMRQVHNNGGIVPQGED
jgi:hypothetical protein